MKLNSKKKIFFIGTNSLEKINVNNNKTFYTTLDRSVEKYIIDGSYNYLNIDKYINDRSLNLSFKDNLRILNLAKQIDIVINQNKSKFFSNYYKLLSGIRHIEKDIKKIEAFVKKNLKNHIFYYADKEKFKNENDRIYLIFKEFSKIYKNIFFIKIIKKQKKKIEFNPLTLQEDLNIDLKRKIKFFIKQKQQTILNPHKKNILFYLIEKPEENYIRKNLKEFNFFNYEYFVKYSSKEKNLGKKKLQEVLKILKSKKYKCPKIYLKYFENIFNKLYSFYEINKDEIEIFLSEKKIDLFITAHSTLISNSIKIECIKKKIPTLTLMHGGNFGHFSNIVPYPQFTASNTIENQSLNYFQVYTNKMQQKIIKGNIYTNNKKYKNKLVKIKSNKFQNINFKKENSLSKKYLSIGYICRSVNNVTSNSYSKFQSEYNFFNMRNSLLSKIQSDLNISLNISTYSNDQKQEFGDRNFIRKLSNENRINFEILNGKKIIENSDIIIFEQFSTLFIEALYSKKPLVYIDNPYLHIFKDQINALKKQVYFVKSNSQLNNLIHSLINKKKNDIIFKKKFASKFIENYYTNKYSISLDKFILKILKK